MAIGDHLAVYFDNQWRHAIQVSEQHVVTLRSLDGSIINADQIPPGDSLRPNRSTVVRMDLEQFQSLGSCKTINTDSEFPPEKIARRACDVLAGVIPNRFGSDSEHFATWCRTGTNASPTHLANRQLKRELQTVEIQHPMVRQILQTISMDCEKDKAAVLSRLALPWLVIGDVTEIGVRLASAVARGSAENSVSNSDNRGGSQDRQRRTKQRHRKAAAQAGAASATALAATIGGPTMAVATLGSWLLSKRTSDNTIERIKESVCREADK